MGFLTPDMPAVQPAPVIVKKSDATDEVQKVKRKFKGAKGRQSTISAGTLTAAAPTLKRTLGAA